MTEPQEIIPIEKSSLLGLVASFFAQGFRLVQIGCTTLENAYELNYSFDKDYTFKNLRFAVQPGEEVQSISVIYPSAFLYENEIHDLFGVAIKDITIDYKGTLYRTAVKTPYSIENCPVPVPAKPKAGKPKENADSTEQSAEAQPTE